MPVIELYQEVKKYLDIAQTVRMFPNTVKAILGRTGLDQYSTESRPYELFSEGLIFQWNDFAPSNHATKSITHSLDVPECGSVP